MFKSKFSEVWRVGCLLLHTFASSLISQTARVLENPRLGMLELMLTRDRSVFPGGSSYAFLSGGQRGEASGPIVDHSLRRGSDESSRASSEYPRSSFEYQRSSFESARSPPMNYDAQRKLSTMLGGASLFDGTLFQPEADLGSSSGRPSLDVQV